MASRRARRDLERRMRELDRLDATYGLGAMPRRRRRTRGRLGPRLRSLALASAVVGVVVTALLYSPIEAGTAMRRLTGINEAERPLPKVKPSESGGTYRVLQRLPNGDPVTYDPCREIHYVINPLDSPPDFSDFITPAIRRVEAATGLRWVFDGLTDEKWTSRSRGLSHRPVLITFNDPDEVRQLAGRTAGLGGSLVTSPEGRTPRYITGSIALDAAWFADASEGHRTAEQTAIVMHELGHVVGLDHVDDPSELMHADNVGLHDFGPGDLRGLARAGAGPCD